MATHAYLRRQLGCVARAGSIVRDRAEAEHNATERCLIQTAGPLFCSPLRRVWFYRAREEGPRMPHGAHHQVKLRDLRVLIEPAGKPKPEGAVAVLIHHRVTGRGSSGISVILCRSEDVPLFVLEEVDVRKHLIPYVAPFQSAGYRSPAELYANAVLHVSAHRHLQRDLVDGHRVVGSG